MNKLPDTIYLQIYGDSECMDNDDKIDFSDVTWSEDRIYPTDVEYTKTKSTWIRAKDRLPPIDENSISEQSEPVLVIVSAKGYYEPEILVYNKHYHIWDTADGNHYECYVSDDDLWMPIPSFDEILEANKDVLEQIKEKGD